MKQPKAPKMEQKEQIKAAGLNWKDWNVVKDGEMILTLQNKSTKIIKTVRKRIQ